MSLSDVVASETNHYNHHHHQKKKNKKKKKDSKPFHDTAALSSPLVLASLWAHRNTLFGAQLGPGAAAAAVAAAARHDHQQQQQVPLPQLQSSSSLLTSMCLPLVWAALDDAAMQGEQPQALATLHGLCEWIRHSKLLLLPEATHKDNTNNNNNDNNNTATDPAWTTTTTTRSCWPSDEPPLSNVEWEAVQAIATGIPRPGHSVVGPGTHRDAAAAWKTLALEFCRVHDSTTTSTSTSTTTASTSTTSNDNNKEEEEERDDPVHDPNDKADEPLDPSSPVESADTATTHPSPQGYADEVNLYRAAGGQVVEIELLADTRPDYLQSAGGAMARLFFV